jgi:Protein of unknown function (DUF3558)
LSSPKLTALAALAIVVLAACSGSAATATGAPASNGAATNAASEAPASTTAPTVGPSVAAATPGASAAAVDTCKLLSAADLKTATGKEYGDGVADDYGQCTWRVGGATVNNGDGQVVAAIQDASLDTIKSTFEGGVDVTVSGHAAYWNPTAGLQSIWVDIGGRGLVISFDPVDADTQSVAVKVAEIAVAKL